MKTTIIYTSIFLIIVVNNLFSQECLPILNYSQSTFYNTNINNLGWTFINTPQFISTGIKSSCANDFACIEDSFNKILRNDISKHEIVENRNINSGFVDYDSSIHTKNDIMLGAISNSGIETEVKLNPEKTYILRFSQANARRFRPRQGKTSACWEVKLDGEIIGKSKYMPLGDKNSDFTWFESTFIIKPSSDKSALVNRTLEIIVRSLPTSYLDVTYPKGRIPYSNYMNYMLIDNITLVQEGACEEVPAITERNNSSFMPKVSTTGKEINYVVSGWVKETRSEGRATSYSSSIDISFAGSTETKSFPPQGAVIDGWQRIEGIFNIPEGSTAINLALKNNALPNAVYFDDIRIHNADGNMKSFVYDPVTQRLMAELDENNYATLYEYDNEGGLVRVKKETERGIYTIQETRSGNSKLNK